MANSFEEYDDMLGEMATGAHSVVLSNNAEYARYLHDREGFYVFNDSHAAQTLVDTMNDVERAGPMTTQRVETGLEVTGVREVNFLQSVTNEMRPPARTGEGPRAAHPGGWADVTGRLNRSYSIEVNGKPRNVLR